MIKPEINLISFCAKYGLPVNKTSNCYKCGIEVRLDIPVITKDWVGLESLVHEPCGERYKISLLKNRHKNIFEDFGEEIE